MTTPLQDHYCLLCYYQIPDLNYSSSSRGQYSNGLMSHFTHYRSFWRRPSQPIAWPVQKPSIPNKSLGWYKQTKSNCNQGTPQKPKQLQKVLTYTKLNLVKLQRDLSAYWHRPVRKRITPILQLLGSTWVTF